MGDNELITATGIISRGISEVAAAFGRSER